MADNYHEYNHAEFFQAWDQFLDDLDFVVKEAHKHTSLAEPEGEEDSLYEIFEEIKRGLKHSENWNTMDDRIQNAQDAVVEALKSEMKIYHNTVSHFKDWLPDDPRDKIRDIIDRLKDLLNLAKTIKDSVKKAAGNLGGLLDVLNELIDFSKKMKDDGLNINSTINEFST